MEDEFYASFSKELVNQVLKLIEDGNPENLKYVLEIQLHSKSLPDWYITEMIQRIYFLLKEKLVNAETQKTREKYMSAIETMDINYNDVLRRKWL